MSAVAEDKTIGDFTDAEIKGEYIERFGDPDDVDLSDFTSSDLIEALENRDAMPDPENPDALEEIADLIAEAARTSRHAAKAYDLLAGAYGLTPLVQRQMLVAGRMAGAA